MCEGQRLKAWLLKFAVSSKSILRTPHSAGGSDVTPAAPTAAGCLALRQLTARVLAAFFGGKEVRFTG